VAQARINVALDDYFGLDLSSLLAALLCILEYNIYCDTENLPMPVEARRAI
jgi:hypothetical protein